MKWLARILACMWFPPSTSIRQITADREVAIVSWLPAENTAYNCAKSLLKRRTRRYPEP